MKQMLTILTTLALCLTAAGAVVRAQDKGGGGDEQGIRQALESYGTAFTRGQAPQAGPAFLPNAEFITAAGVRIKGREAIVQRLRDYLSKHKGDTLKLTANSILFVTPEVAQVDGDSELRGPGGPPEVSPYTAIMVKRDGRWLMQSLRDLGDPSPETAVSAADRLKELEWMVGQWTQSSEGSQVRATCRWDPGRHFLLWDYTVRQGSQEVMTVYQRIGWDPQKGQFRSWVFDSVGGFAEGQWDASDDGAWVIRQAGVLPDGGTASATCFLVPVERSSFRWRMTDRRVDGDRLADVDLRFTKSGGAGR